MTRQNKVGFISPTGNFSIAAGSVEAPNGIALSPDNRILYLAAYRQKKVIKFRIDAPGILQDASEFAGMNDGDSLGADGMTVDRAGNVYCAGATDIWIWNPAGQLLDRIPCPARPINCAFGDSDLRSLYITAFDGVHRQRMKISGVAAQPRHTPAPDKRLTLPDPAIPKSVTAHLDVVYAQYGTRRLLADIFVPKSNSNTPLPAVVVVHGGGWLNGDKTKFRAMAVALAKQGFVTANIEYRLGHEATFPARNS